LSFNYQLVGKLYMDTAALTWNGNAVAGRDNVLKFLEDIPECAHAVDGYDAQPVASMYLYIVHAAVSSQNTVT